MRFDENNLRHIWHELHDIEQRLGRDWNVYTTRAGSVRDALHDSGPMAGQMLAQRPSVRRPRQAAG